MSNNNINNNLNVLIFPSGSGVSKEIFDALKYIRWINIYGIDADKDNFSYYQFQNFISDAPFIKDEESTLSYLKDLIESKNIHCIFPAMDNIIYFLKKYENVLGIKIISSELTTCDICMSKSKTYELLSDIIQVPKVFSPKDDIIFPVFIKPDVGYGSRNSYKIDNDCELNRQLEKHENMIVCEYLPGNEYTVDCFTSKKNGLIFCEARIRKKTLNGMSILTETVNIDGIKEMAEIINMKINFIGAWFFQVKYNQHNTLTLLEVAPRIPGAMSIHRIKGINFPLLSIYEHFNYNIDNLLINNYNAKCYKYFENNYILDFDYKTVYVDLDDTIIIKNKVNTQLMKYLYQCINKNKEIVLITRNNNPLNKLNNYRISDKLFDRIIVCAKDELKSNYILDDNAIFIDDSYMERSDVYNKNINVFNCDMIECLIDDKL
jgi:carbamoylphosphate synthase large subunit